MVQISYPEITVLGLLHEHHHYAHRLVEIMEKRGMDNWADVNYSSIMNILQKLESSNLIKSSIREEKEEGKKEENKGHVKDKIYYITPEGELVLKEKIKGILEGQYKLFNPLDLGLANLYVLNHDEQMECLKLYLDNIKKRLDTLEYAMSIQTGNNIPPNFIAIYSRSIELLKSEKKWLQEFIEEI